MDDFEIPTSVLLQPKTLASLAFTSSVTTEFPTGESSHATLTKSPSIGNLSDLFAGKTLNAVQKGTGKIFSLTIKLLPSAKSAADVAGSLKLQEVITANLQKDGHEGFITQKSANAFMALTDMEHGITVGVFDNATGKLIGQSSVSFANLKDSPCDILEDTTPIGYNPSMLDCTKIQNIFEVKGTMVDPSYSGMSLAGKIATYIEDVVKITHPAATVLMAEVAVDNAPNLHVCSTSGFKALQKYVASDGVECYLLYKPMGPIFAASIGFSDIAPLKTSQSQSTEMVLGGGK